VSSLDKLKLVWRYRIRPTAEIAAEVDEGRHADLIASYEALVRRLEGTIDANEDN
jgi:hypothetical protein